MDSRAPAHAAARRLAGAIAIALLLGPVVGATGAHAGARARTGATQSVTAEGGWTWPVAAFRLERPYAAPPHPYGTGHRGIDVRPVGVQRIVSPAGGVVAFTGPVADRAVVTIDHGGGLVTTLEPVVSGLEPGTRIHRGEVLGDLAVGGHADAGTLHIGLRLDGEYLNPVTMLGGVPRAVLLPCC